MSKRYILFSGNDNNSDSGAASIVDIFATEEEARSYGLTSGDWAHVYDLETKKVVCMTRLTYQNSDLLETDWINMRS